MSKRLLLFFVIVLVFFANGFAKIKFNPVYEGTIYRLVAKHIRDEAALSHKRTGFSKEVEITTKYNNLKLEAVAEGFIAPGWDYLSKLKAILLKASWKETSQVRSIATNYTINSEKDRSKYFVVYRDYQQGLHMSSSGSYWCIHSKKYYDIDKAPLCKGDRMMANPIVEIRGKGLIAPFPGPKDDQFTIDTDWGLEILEGEEPDLNTAENNDSGILDLINGNKGIIVAVGAIVASKYLLSKVKEVNEYSPSTDNSTLSPKSSNEGENKEYTVYFEIHAPRTKNHYTPNVIFYKNGDRSAFWSQRNSELANVQDDKNSGSTTLSAGRWEVVLSYDSEKESIGWLVVGEGLPNKFIYKE